MFLRRRSQAGAGGTIWAQVGAGGRRWARAGGGSRGEGALRGRLGLERTDFQAAELDFVAVVLEQDGAFFGQPKAGYFRKLTAGDGGGPGR